MMVQNRGREIWVRTMEVASRRVQLVSLSRVADDLNSEQLASLIHYGNQQTMNKIYQVVEAISENAFRAMLRNNDENNYIAALHGGDMNDRVSPMIDYLNKCAIELGYVMRG